MSQVTSLRGAALAALLAAPLATLAATPVFINELHYDNTGSPDTDEGVEIAGPVGTDLSGWSVVLYNGASSQRKVYDTLPVSGVISANCGAMADGVMHVPVESGGQIQNGAPDGLALVDAGGDVVQFLSYEGSFTAVDGPAAGLTSTDIGVMEPSDTPVGQSLQLTGAGANYEDFTWTGPTQASFGACNAGQTFGAAVDVPPTVATTVPANGATGVAVTSTITINFSETVTVAAGAIGLVCDGNVVAGAQAASGSNATFTPGAALPHAATCSVTVTASAVTDQDGASDAMAGDYTFGFQTEGDLPPSVAATNPTDGTASFPAGGNLAVTFTEPVTLDAGWYDLACDSSGAHTAVPSGSDADYGLNPDQDFTALESCTWTIHASAVRDVDGTADAMAADKIVHFTVSGGTGDYYAGVDTSSGPALEAWLHTRVTTAPAPYTSIVAFPYSSSTETDTWDILKDADQDPNNPANILDLYKNASLPWLGGGQQAYNREHTWPKSLGFPNQTINNLPNPPYNDLHMLHLADTGYNAQRGNGLLGNCTGSACVPLWTVATNGFGGNQNNRGDANWKNGDVMFEVWDHRKGDVARSVMYMAVRYDGGVDAAGICEPDLQLTDNASLVQTMNAQAAAGCTGTANVAYNGLMTDLLVWNQQDPPDDQERLRNDVVFAAQHNRNPFIDHPEWAACVFTGLNCPAANDTIFKDGFDAVTP